MHSPGSTPRPRIRRPLVAVGLLAIAVGVAAPMALLAPGAGAASESATAAAKAKADFITRADAVCQSGKNAMRRALEAHENRVGFAARSGGRYAKVKIASPDSVAEYVSVVLPMIESQVRQLQLIPAPSADRQLIATLLRDTSAAIVAAKRNPRQVAYDDPFHDLGKRYRAYGFQQCGTSDRPWTEEG